MITEEQIEIQQILRVRIKKAGIKQVELSRRIQCPYGSLNQYLNGIYPMPEYIKSDIYNVLKEVEG